MYTVIKWGKVVTISGWINVKTGIATKSVLVSDLPVPKVNINVLCFDQSDSTIWSLYIAYGSSNLTTEYGIGIHAGHILNISVTYSIE